MRFKYYSVRMPQLSFPQLAALQSLGLANVSDVSLLCWATGLTHLDLGCQIERGDRFVLQGLCPAVSGMSRLRSLDISFMVHSPQNYDYGDDGFPVEVLRLKDVLRACTMLTKLVCRNLGLRPHMDLEACWSHRGLRSLTFSEYKITTACLPPLQAMSGLTELHLLHTDIQPADMTPAVIAAFDAERRKLGWPLLNLRIKTYKGCFERLGAANRVRTEMMNSCVMFYLNYCIHVCEPACQPHLAGQV